MFVWQFRYLFDCVFVSLFLVCLVCLIVDLFVCVFVCLFRCVCLLGFLFAGLTCLFACFRFVCDFGRLCV